MTPGSTWIELLTCPQCGQSGTAHLSQPEGSAFGTSVEAMPAGFKVANHEFGETFFCEVCDRLAVTTYPGQLSQANG